MFRTLTTFLSLGLATAAPSLMARQDTEAPASRKLLIGAPSQILTADFDGSSFSITNKYTKSGFAPSWLLPKKNLLYAVNENSNNLNLFKLDQSSNNLSLDHNVWGSSGVVFLEFNSDQTRLVGAAYGNGSVDVWDSSAENGTLRYIKYVNVSNTDPSAPGQPAHHPHQSLLDPTGRYFVIPDLGSDKILLLDGKEDRWEVSVATNLPPGSGPRHGGFLRSDETNYYVLASELSNELFLYQLQYTDDSIGFTEIERQSTYGAAFPPTNDTSAAAGELVVAKNQKDVYVSNRLTGNETDSIAHFVFDAPGNGTAGLRFVDTISSGGRLPRMFSLSADDDQSLVFVANQAGDNGLVAFKRCPDSGTLNPTPVATLPGASLVAPELLGTPSSGPQFVLEI